MRTVYEATEAESKKSRFNFGKVAVDAKREERIRPGDVWRAFDAAAYVTEIFDPLGGLQERQPSTGEVNVTPPPQGR